VGRHSLHLTAFPGNEQENIKTVVWVKQLTDGVRTAFVQRIQAESWFIQLRFLNRIVIVNDELERM
jgi:hypothetical protein